MADEKAKIVTDATGPGSGPAPAQPEAAAQVPKQEQPAPEVLAPDKAEAPAQEAPVSQDKACLLYTSHFYTHRGTNKL